MDRAEGIRKYGFRRWYERQLIVGHGYLVTCFLCIIMIAACAETVNLRAPGARPLVMIALLLAGCVLAAWSWRRYFAVLMRAEHTGEQSTCGACGTYGRYEVIEPPPSNAAKFFLAAGFDTEHGAVRLRVRCRKCGDEWMVE
jgi:hypothetical protein